MSIENHPNFHAVNFVTKVLSAFYESLRGQSNKDNCPNISSDVIRFAEMIEDKINSSVIQPNSILDLDQGDLVTILELARVALSDADIYDRMVDKLDLSDEYAKELQETLNILTDNLIDEKSS